MQQAFWYIITALGLAQVLLHYTVNPAWQYEIAGCIVLNSIALGWNYAHGFMKFRFFKIMFWIMLIAQPLLSYYYIQHSTITHAGHYALALVAIISGVAWIVLAPKSKPIEALSTFYFLVYFIFMAFAVHHIFSSIFTIIACNTWMTIAVDRRIQELKKHTYEHPSS